jgi:uncharacterized protein
MKYLLVVLVVMVAFWLWKKNRAGDGAASAAPKPRRDAPPADNKPQLMLRCAHCGTHLPQVDAVSGRKGHYCSLAHRQKSEG